MCANMCHFYKCEYLLLPRIKPDHGLDGTFQPAIKAPTSKTVSNSTVTYESVTRTPVGSLLRFTKLNVVPVVPSSGVGVLCCLDSSTSAVFLTWRTSFRHAYEGKCDGETARAKGARVGGNNLPSKQARQPSEVVYDRRQRKKPTPTPPTTTVPPPNDDDTNTNTNTTAAAATTDNSKQFCSLWKHGRNTIEIARHPQIVLDLFT